jgi:HK97 family phage major capsid protein
MLDVNIQRRQVIASQVRDLINTRGPRTSQQKATLDSLLREADELEHGIHDEAERRKLDAFGRFLKTGQDESGLLKRSTAHLEIRDMGEAGLGTGVATGAGALVPVEFSRMVDEAMKLLGPLTDSDVVTFDNTDHGRNINRPSDNDTSISATLLGEGQQTTMQDIPVLGQSILGAWKLSSGLIKVSLELMSDAGFDFTAYMATKLAIRIARGLNPLLTTGTGVNQPKGLVTSIVDQGNVIQNISGNTLSPDDFSNLEAQIDPIYRATSSWQVSSSTLKSLRQAKDSVGNYSFKQLHSDNVAEDYVFGYPIRVNNALANIPATSSSPATVNNVLLFGDMKQFRVRRVQPILYRLNERFAEFAQVAFLMLQRYDCALCDGGAGAVKALQIVY